MLTEYVARCNTSAMGMTEKARDRPIYDQRGKVVIPHRLYANSFTSRTGTKAVVQATRRGRYPSQNIVTAALSRAGRGILDARQGVGEKEAVDCGWAEYPEKTGTRWSACPAKGKRQLCTYSYFRPNGRHDGNPARFRR